MESNTDARMIEPSDVGARGRARRLLEPRAADEIGCVVGAPGSLMPGDEWMLAGRAGNVLWPLPDLGAPLSVSPALCPATQ